MVFKLNKRKRKRELLNKVNTIYFVYFQAYADERRGAKEDMGKHIGDKVLVKELVKGNKTTPNFGATEYEIIQRSGSDLLVRSDDTGKEYRRHITHVKKIIPTPSPLDTTTDISSTELASNELQGDQLANDSSTDVISTRPKRQTNKPKRFTC